MRKPGATTTGLIYDYASGRTDAFDHLLYDFDIDDASLKSQHQTDLEAALTFMQISRRSDDARRPYWTVHIDGYTSHTGSTAHNKALSQRREQEVQKYLEAGLATHGLMGGVQALVRFAPDFHGFDQTTVVGEDPVGRAVRVAITSPGAPAPPRVVPPGYHETDPRKIALLERFVSLDWVNKALTRLLPFRAALLTRSAPPNSPEREALLAHFHIVRAEDHRAEIDAIIARYQEISRILATEAESTFIATTDEETRRYNLGGVPHAWTYAPRLLNRPIPPGTRFTSRFVADRPDCRRAVIIHELVHFTEPEPNASWPDIGEGDPNYSSPIMLPPLQAVHNPSSYATAARQLATGRDIRNACL